MQKATYENKSAISLHGVKSGEKFEIDVDRDGVPLERKWRDRVRDSKIDGCIQPVKKKGAK